MSPRIHIVARDRLAARPETRQPSPEPCAASHSPSDLSNRSPNRDTDRRPFSPSPTRRRIASSPPSPPGRRAALRPGPGTGSGRPKGKTGKGKGQQGKQGKKGKKGNKQRRVHFADDSRGEG